MLHRFPFPDWIIGTAVRLIFRFLFTGFSGLLLFFRGVFHRVINYVKTDLSDIF